MMSVIMNPLNPYAGRSLERLKSDHAEQRKLTKRKMATPACAYFMVLFSVVEMLRFIWLKLGAVILKPLLKDEAS